MHFRQTLAPGFSRFCSELVTRQRVPSWTGSGGAHTASLVSGHWVEVRDSSLSKRLEAKDL